MQQVIHGLDSSILSKRSQHNSIAIENVRNGVKTRAARIVVYPDRRVIENLENLGLWRAYESISKAISIRTAGLGVQSMDLSAARGGTGSMERGTELLAKYDKWFEECKKKYLAPLLVRKMIVDGMSFNAIDNEYKFYKGSSKLKIYKCLELWYKI